MNSNACPRVVNFTRDVVLRLIETGVDNRRIQRIRSQGLFTQQPHGEVMSGSAFRGQEPYTLELLGCASDTPRQRRQHSQGDQGCCLACRRPGRPSPRREGTMLQHCRPVVFFDQLPASPSRHLVGCTAAAPRAGPQVLA